MCFLLDLSVLLKRNLKVETGLRALHHPKWVASASRSRFGKFGAAFSRSKNLRRSSGRERESDTGAEAYRHVLWSSSAHLDSLTHLFACTNPSSTGEGCAVTVYASLKTLAQQARAAAREPKTALARAVQRLDGPKLTLHSTLR
jgi:hypothetical protein